MNKRRLFSDADGTKIGEDLSSIFNELKTKLFDFVRKHGDIAEKIIEFLKLVDAQIKEGTPTDKVIDAVLAKIPGNADEKIYKFIQENLPRIILVATDMLDEIGETEMISNMIVFKERGWVNQYESLRHKTASILLQSFVAEQGEEISRVESDTCIQVVYFAGVGSA